MLIPPPSGEGVSGGSEGCIPKRLPVQMKRVTFRVPPDEKKVVVRRFQPRDGLSLKKHKINMGRNRIHVNLFANGHFLTIQHPPTP